MANADCFGTNELKMASKALYARKMVEVKAFRMKIFAVNLVLFALFGLVNVHVAYFEKGFHL